MNKQWKLRFSLAAALLAGCATGSSNDGEPDASRDADASDAVADIGPDVEDTEVTGDVVLSDGADDVLDTGESPDVDTSLSDAGSDCEVLNDECEPESVRCDGSELVFCGRCGAELRRDSCEADELCEETDGVGACRPCVGDECPDVLECEAGTRTCVSYNTQQICGPDGRVANVVTCPAGRRCIGGGCVPEGADVGAACIADADCAGQSCLCGTEFRAANAGAACSDLPQGYCSTAMCDDSGCDPNDEACVLAPILGASLEAPVCVSTEECTARGASCGNGVCEELPGGASRDWALTCWPDFPTVGEACGSDADCLGGDCRTKTVGGSVASYCVAPCGDQSACPSHAECVEDLDANGQFACFARNDAESCPRSDSQPILFGGSQPSRRYGGGVATVCYFR
jgi:hypothetical protein